jgi:hypothetical protein
LKALEEHFTKVVDPHNDRTKDHKWHPFAQSFGRVFSLIDAQQLQSALKLNRPGKYCHACLYSRMGRSKPYMFGFTFPIYPAMQADFEGCPHTLGN